MLAKRFDYKYLVKGLTMCLILTVIALIVLALILKFTSLSESKLPMFNNLIIIISVAIGSIYASGKSKENGWLIGALIGLIYYIFILILNILFIKDVSFTLLIIPKLVMSTFAGVIGGIIGINIK